MSFRMFVLWNISLFILYCSIIILQEPYVIFTDSYTMLTVDMDEQVALFLRSIYLSCPSGKRPNLLYQSIQESRRLVSAVTLKDIIESLDTPLPQLEKNLMTISINWRVKENVFTPILPLDICLTFTSLPSNAVALNVYGRKLNDATTGNKKHLIYPKEFISMFCF